MEKVKKITRYQLEKDRLIELIFPQYCDGDIELSELEKLSLKQLKELERN
jgi:hypothetical protein